MAKENKTYKIFLSTVEPSADSHCASLITSLQKSPYNIEFTGTGGTKMAQAGCQMLEETTSKAVMIYNAFTQIAYFHKLIKKIASHLKTNKSDLVILCDSPSLNFHIAKAAKKLGTKTLFYVAPQLWAWAPWRIRKLRKYCDKLCCILPFEQDWFSQKGIDVTFVGNPLLDKLEGNLSFNKKYYLGFEPDKANIALMPGSRTAEISSLWQPMQQIAILLKKKFPDITFTTVAVNTQQKQTLQSRQIPDFRCSYNIGSVHETTLASDLAIVASGSATLQVAAAGCPMVVMYQSSRILWHLAGRWLVTTKFLSLVNVLARKELVPEFMPYFSSIKPVAESVEKLLTNKADLVRISAELIELAKPLAKKKASETVSKTVIEMLG